MKKKIAIIALFICFLVNCIIQNNVIKISTYEIKTSKVLNPVRIVHLSDLHDKQFGEYNKTLIAEIKQKEPDIIVFTGDLIDSRCEDFTVSVNTLSELNKLVQVYYIPGNHEYRSGKSDVFFEMLNNENIEILKNDTRCIIANGEIVDIIGIDETVSNYENIRKKLIEFEKSNSYKVLLSHFPENFSRYYNKYNIDLVLSGHAHGGQFNLPFIGGLYAPGQGFFPKYYKGIHTENGVNLIVSRGLGNSSFPLRVFNNPEIVVINLIPSKD